MLLRELRHPNILQLHDAHINNSGSDVAISLIFEFVDHDVHEMMQCQKGYNSVGQHKLPVQHFPAQMVRSLFWQLLRGLAHLHTKWVIHRDLKPSNLLVTGAASERPGVRPQHTHSHVNKRCVVTRHTKVADCRSRNTDSKCLVGSSCMCTATQHQHSASGQLLQSDIH